LSLKKLKSEHLNIEENQFGVRLWGTRGSIPAPKTPEMLYARLRDTLIGFVNQHPTVPAGRADKFVDEYLGGLPKWHTSGFGGDTSCVEVVGAREPVIIDAGSGLRRLGEKLMAGACGKGQGIVHLLFTHFHWDHVIGLPFFTPVFIPGNEIHIYAVQPDLEECVQQVFKKPFFPVPFAELGAKIVFHRLEPRKPFQLSSLTITPYMLDHPDPCWGYRIDASTVAGKKSYAHCVDSEATRVLPIDLGEDVALYRDADLCYFDAQYTLHEFLNHMNWGHSTAPIGLEMALREGVRKILFAHHDPAASDLKISDAERQTGEFFASYQLAAQKGGRSLPPLEWSFARDGEYFALGTLIR
jgi:phosphoribosyl 1,2-cyclic phosphodiesterase